MSRRRRIAPGSTEASTDEIESSDCSIPVAARRIGRTAIAMAPDADGEVVIEPATVSDLGFAISLVKMFGITSDSGRPRWTLFAGWILVFTGLTVVSEILVIRWRRTMHAPIASNIAPCAMLGVGCIAALIAFRLLSGPGPLHQAPDPEAWRRRASRRREKTFNALTKRSEEQTAADNELEQDAGTRSSRAAGVTMQELVALVGRHEARVLMSSFSISSSTVLMFVCLPLIYLGDVFATEDGDTSYGQALAITLIRMTPVLPMVLLVISVANVGCALPLVLVARIRAVVADFRMRTPDEHAALGLSNITFEIASIYELVDHCNNKLVVLTSGAVLIALGILRQVLVFMTDRTNQLSAVLVAAGLLVYLVIFLLPFAILNAQLGALQRAAHAERGEAAIAQLSSEQHAILVRDMDTLLHYTTTYTGGSKFGGVVVTIGLLKAIVVGVVSLFSAIYSFANPS
eukprot:a512146_17.p1 GENE.a512146_17~~a512146_17.p1  ORF type:complete len:473 (-),score=105.41 a512146_17:37-1416(-)